MLRYVKFIFSFLGLVFSTGFSQTKMPTFFSNNMVLQQQQNVAVWGTDKPGSIIEIHTSWGVEKRIKTEANGKWQTKIGTKKGSFEKQEITITGSSIITLSNVLIGEVWFCSGQSNMEMAMRDSNKPAVTNAKELIETSKNTHIRLFNTERSASMSLENNVVGTWEEARPESVTSFSAVGYLFGRKLFKELQVPIGIIEASWGGTLIETWLPKKSIGKYPKIKIPKSISKEQKKQTKPTFLYNAMIHPFKNYTIKGFLWYQGEGNRGNAKPYKNYMHTLVDSWRAQWQQKKLPFYFVQIAPYNYKKKHKSKRQSFGANLLRESQSLAAQEIANSGIVITTDVGKCNEIHPPEKKVIAYRLADWALVKQYNFKNIPYRSPEYKSIKIKKDKAILCFNFYKKNNLNHKFDKNSVLKNFVIAGKDQIFYPAEVKINKNQTLTIYSTKVKEPMAVRYGFVDCLEGSLFSNAGLPVSPFRTDAW